MATKFYRKNIIDLNNVLPTITITDATATNTGQLFVDLMRNRQNSSGWATTGSDDAAGTLITVEFGDLKEFDSIMLLQHNFADFDVKYWNGSAYVAFPVPQVVASNVLENTFLEFDLIESTRIQIEITGTIVADADKFMRQLVVCERLGTFTTIEPFITVEISRERKTTKFLSGKSFVSRQVGGVGIRMKQVGVADDTDLALLERLYGITDGFLVSISGGTTSQFETQRQGYRPQDLYFMLCMNEYEPNWLEGRYTNGLEMDLRLAEVN